jgi:copper chaperone CopZ
LYKLPGVLHASVDLPAQRAIVSYLSGHLTHQEIVRSIRECGHQSIGAPAKPSAEREERVLAGTVAL